MHRSVLIRRRTAAPTVRSITPSLLTTNDPPLSAGRALQPGLDPLEVLLQRLRHEERRHNRLEDHEREAGLHDFEALLDFDAGTGRRDLERVAHMTRLPLRLVRDAMARSVLGDRHRVLLLAELLPRGLK